MTEYKKLLKNTNFLYLWISQILSQLTIQILNFLLIIKVFRETGSAISIALLWIIYGLPSILIGPFASASVDMFDRKKMLQISNFLQALVIFFYALFQGLNLFLLYGAIFAYSFLNQFYVPSEVASLPSLVKRNYLSFATSLFFITQQISLIVGIGIAGPLSHLLGFKNALFLCSFFVFIAYLSVSFLPNMKTKEIKLNFENALAKYFQQIIQGYKYIKENKLVIYPFLLLLGMQVSLSIIIVNIPLIAEDIYLLSVEKASYYIILPSGVGAVIGAFSVPRLLRRGVRKRKMIEKFLLIITLAFFLITFLLSELSMSYRVIVGAILVFFFGLSLTAIIITVNTFLQETTPKDLRGRVFGNYGFVLTLATILPIILSATLTEIFGIKLLILIYFTTLIFIKRGNFSLMNSKLEILTK